MATITKTRPHEATAFVPSPSVSVLSMEAFEHYVNFTSYYGGLHHQRSQQSLYNLTPPETPGVFSIGTRNNGSHMSIDAIVKHTQGNTPAARPEPITIPSEFEDSNPSSKTHSVGSRISYVFLPPDSKKDSVGVAPSFLDFFDEDDTPLNRHIPFDSPVPSTLLNRIPFNTSESALGLFASTSPNTIDYPTLPTSDPSPIQPSPPNSIPLIVSDPGPIQDTMLAPIPLPAPSPDPAPVLQSRVLSPVADPPSNRNSAIDPIPSPASDHVAIRYSTLHSIPSNSSVQDSDFPLPTPIQHPGLSSTSLLIQHPGLSSTSLPAAPIQHSELTTPPLPAPIQRPETPIPWPASDPAPIEDSTPVLVPVPASAPAPFPYPPPPPIPSPTTKPVAADGRSISGSSHVSKAASSHSKAASHVSKAASHVSKAASHVSKAASSHVNKANLANKFKNIPIPPPPPRFTRTSAIPRKRSETGIKVDRRKFYCMSSKSMSAFHDLEIDSQVEQNQGPEQATRDDIYTVYYVQPLPREENEEEYRNARAKRRGAAPVQTTQPLGRQPSFIERFEADPTQFLTQKKTFLESSKDFFRRLFGKSKSCQNPKDNKGRKLTRKPQPQPQPR